MVKNLMNKFGICAKLDLGNLKMISKMQSKNKRLDNNSNQRELALNLKIQEYFGKNISNIAGVKLECSSAL